ncbi:hypothetical protein AVEN_251573-1 [Araneus ventricosus]|uniref:Uncharacterized protein n=1 Tax=Araneus ventricosus TaxID=182803 RepID=A0A4Y2FDM6_ARAVE|nr:hypothetical protein AVEN_251573-1 [Araneus ventricosus]
MRWLEATPPTQEKKHPLSRGSKSRQLYYQTPRYAHEFGDCKRDSHAANIHPKLPPQRATALSANISLGSSNNMIKFRNSLQCRVSLNDSSGFKTLCNERYTTYKDG